MKILKARLYEVKRNEKDKERVEGRRQQIGTGGREERIRTYNEKEVDRTTLLYYTMEPLNKGHVGTSSHFVLCREVGNVLVLWESECLGP